MAPRTAPLQRSCESHAIEAPIDHDQQRDVRPSEPGSGLGRTAPILETPAEGPASGAASPRGLAVWIATAGGVGFFPVAPGTAGSLAAALVFLVTEPFGLAVHLVLVALATVGGTLASGASEVAFGRHDDGRIVIDEVAGQWIALTPLLVLPLEGSAFLVGVVTAFVAFRVFDIWKPGPVRWAERRFRGGVGVMADDCVAGVMAAVVLIAVLVSGPEAWLAGGGIA